MLSARLGALASGIGLIVLPALASAAPTAAEREAIRAACPVDYKAHCANVPPGGLPALQCLQTNLAKLSPACQAAVKAATGG